MGLRENFKQAAKELLDPPKEDRTPEPTPVVREEGLPTAEPAKSAKKDRAASWQPAAQARKEPLTPARPDPAPVSPDPAPARQELPGQPESPKQTTLIAACTVIQGSVQTDGNLELYGEIQGDITGKGSLKLCGKLGGNAAGEDMALCGAQVKGDLCASGSVRIDAETVVIGDLQAASLTINGRIKGCVTVLNELRMESHAVVSGPTTAAKLIVAEGAMLQGEVRIAGADIERVFREKE